MIKKAIFFKILIIYLIIMFIFPITSSNSFSKNNDLDNINSKSYVVIDRKSNLIITGKKENEKRKMASTTKIMTGILIIENCDLNKVVRISKKAASIGGSKLGLKKDDTITINDLLYGLLLKSGNDCAIALSEYLCGNVENFCIKMNEKSKKLRIKKHKF